MAGVRPLTVNGVQACGHPQRNQHHKFNESPSKRQIQNEFEMTHGVRVESKSQFRERSQPERSRVLGSVSRQTGGNGLVPFVC
jgi:hypothetical protein